MSDGKYVFAQLFDSLSKYEFDKCVARYNGNLPIFIRITEDKSHDVIILGDLVFEPLVI